MNKKKKKLSFEEKVKKELKRYKTYDEKLAFIDGLKMVIEDRLNELQNL